MKKIRNFILCGLILLSLSALFACNKPMLTAPVGLRIDSDTLVLSWSEISDCDSYSVSINGDARTVRKNEYELEKLEAGTYTICVKAISSVKAYVDSAWSESIEFTRDAETGLVYKLINGRREYEIVGAGKATGEVVIEDTYRGKPVTQIGDAAFYNCTKITDLTLGNNVRSIGMRAFYNCSYIEKITIPDSVTTISANAFQNCFALKEINLPSRLTEIGDSMFQNCAALTSLNLDGIKSIGKSAFAGCNGLTSLTLPDSVESIGEYAFAGCAGLQSVNIGKGLKALQKYAFSACGSLTNVSIGNGVTELGEGAFYNCKALASIVVPDSVESIRQFAFYGDEKLVSVKLGDGIRHIESNAFSATALWVNSGDFVYADKWLIESKVVILDSLTIRDDTVGIASFAFSKVLGDGLAVITLPDSIKYLDNSCFSESGVMRVTFGENLVSIGENAFSNCSYLDAVTFGPNLKKIGNYAFDGCDRLKSKFTKFPDSLESIGTYAFYGTGFWNEAETLVYVDNWLVGNKASRESRQTLSDTTVGIADYVFYKNSNLLSVYIPKSVAYIGRAAFAGCSKLSSVVLPDKLSQINEYTFYGCSELGSMKLPDGLTSIGRSAFYECGNMDNIVIPDSVKSIGSYAFYGCSAIKTNDGGETKLKLGSGLTTIGEYAFSKCEDLISVTIPSGVTDIGAHAFERCDRLTEVYFDDGCSAVGEYMFRECPELNRVSFSDSVKSIGRYAFVKCGALASVNLKSAESIGVHAFNECSSLRSVAFSDKLKSIGDFAFFKCSGLSSVTLGKDVEKVGKHAFYGCKSMTVFLEADEIPEGFDTRWNSSYRPTLLSCELKSDNGALYVYSFTVDYSKIINADSVNESAPDNLNGISVPTRYGYVCTGWSNIAGGVTAVLNICEIVEAPEERTMYIVWARTIQ